MPPMPIPPAPRSSHVDSYHGLAVPDPFRPLEDPDAPETVAWVEAQNARTASFLQDGETYERLKARLTALYNYPRYSAPSRHGPRYLFSRNDGLQAQAVLYRQESLDGVVLGEDATVVLDPNTLSDDGTVALTRQSYSHDGVLLAYGTSRDGSDRQEIRIRTVVSGDEQPETIRHCKFASIAWRPDGSGFYYDRFPAPGSVPAEDENNYSRVYLHTIGTVQEADSLVYELPERKEWGFSPWIADDAAYLVLYVTHGTDPRNGLLYRPLAGGTAFQSLAQVGEANFNPIEIVGETLYLRTDLGAPRGRIVAVDLAAPARDGWREIVPESDDVIETAILAGDQLVVLSMRDAHHRIDLYTLEGAAMGEIALPTLGSVGELSGRREDPDLFLSFTSFLYPTTIFRYIFAARTLTPIQRPAVDFDAGDYQTSQVFAPSKDGTRVPIFLTHKRGMALDGTNPTILYGYGGFNVSLTPSFSVSRLLWLEQGGILAVANLRGGGEYGEEWHRAGMLERKQNVFDDFIACAEWLTAARYTSAERLASNGGSNGGLLVAACMTQRPELFGAVVCQVPVTDMLRYQRFTIGRYWVPEYGTAEADPQQFATLFAYSPLHNIYAGAPYPPTLITSADTDDRVVPAHAKKFAAALQDAYQGPNPILLRVDTQAGHGMGKPTAKLIEEQAAIYTFLLKAFGIERR